MTTSTASLFFALLTIAAWAATVAVVVLVFVARRSESDTVIALRTDASRLALGAACAVAAIATLGSLYYSEIAKFTPCKLCWYQRIAIYPLAVLLGIAAVRRDRDVRGYVIAQCSLGGAVAAYHSFIVAYPPESGTSFCTTEAPCTERYVWEFGFISLPMMALTAMALIIALMVAAQPLPTDAKRPPPGNERSTR